MLFKLTTDKDMQTRDVVYKTAHVVYAETAGVSLRLVEAMMSMIANNAIETNRSVNEIIDDENIFDVLCPKSPNHKYLTIANETRGFQMCLRVALRMVNGNLPDSCHGATRFHRASELPDWAVSRGYIYETDDFLFYT